MGAFNTVLGTVSCPRCHSSVGVRVQFKYADTRQHEYRLGDVLRWGGNDIGLSGKRYVVVDGVAEGACVSCGFDGEWAFYVIVERDRITRLVLADGSYDFAKTGATHLVLKD